MTLFLQVLQLLAGLLPVIHQAVQEIGPLFPNASQGEAKADAIVQVVSAALPPGTPDTHVQAVQAAIPAIAAAITAARAVAASFEGQQQAGGA